MSINQKNTIQIKSLNGDNIKLVKDFKYLVSYIGSTEHGMKIIISDYLF